MLQIGENQSSLKEDVTGKIKQSIYALLKLNFYTKL